MERLDINTLSVTELKALIYDHVVQAEQLRQLISSLERELYNKQQEAQNVEQLHS
jgi:hypothetical protein